MLLYIALFDADSFLGLLHGGREVLVIFPFCPAVATGRSLHGVGLGRGRQSCRALKEVRDWCFAYVPPNLGVIHMGISINRGPKTDPTIS